MSTTHPSRQTVMSTSEAEDLRRERAAGIRRTLFVTLAMVGLVLGMFVVSVVMPRAPTRDELLQLNFFQLSEPRPLAPFSLQTHERRPFVPQSLVAGVGSTARPGTNGWSLVFFGFVFCPDICPTTMAVLNRAVSLLDEGTRPPQVYLVTVDPDRDDADALSRYVPAFNPDFIGVTGEFADIVTLATQLNVAFGKVPGPQPDTYTVDHSATVAAIDPQGRYHGFFKMPHDPQHMATVIQRLMSQ